MGPRAGQLIELEAAVEYAQIIRGNELNGYIHLIAQLGTQDFSHAIDHRRLAGGRRQYLHAQRLVVERHHKTGTAHAAQLLKHHRPVSHRQRTNVADTGHHRMGQAAGTRDQPLKLRGAQLGYPDDTGQRLGQQHRQQGQQQHAPEQRTRQPRLTQAQHWPPVDNHCRAPCGSTAAVCRYHAGAGASG